MCQQRALLDRNVDCVGHNQTGALDRRKQRLSCLAAVRSRFFRYYAAPVPAVGVLQHRDLIFPASQSRRTKIQI
jgi:hypothetical protein